MEYFLLCLKQNTILLLLYETDYFEVHKYLLVLYTLKMNAQNLVYTFNKTSGHVLWFNSI